MCCDDCCNCSCADGVSSYDFDKATRERDDYRDILTHVINAYHFAHDTNSPLKFGELVEKMEKTLKYTHA